jgi:NAD-dependent SIR2 family protein deacetylase
MNETGLDPAALDAAARLIGEADALLVCAGAGMGVDSGLPDFRGDEGFWKAYPPYARLGLSFADLADPAHFDADPELAWGFYGHRLGLYRATVPHAGFHVLRSWGERLTHGVRVSTSNVDGQFQRAGFDNVAEVHGSIHHLQCHHPCSDDVWPADDIDVEVDEDTMRAVPPLPRCRHCGGLARPNILMFGDWAWIGGPAEAQERELAGWLRMLASTQSRLAVVELGAGKAIPTVRMRAERTATTAAASGQRSGGALIRINPDPAAAAVPPGAGVALAAGALAALTAIDARLRHSTQPSTAFRRRG